MTDERRRFGAHLRDLRKERRLSQEALAALAEMSYKFLGEIERGKGNPSFDVLSKLASALEIDLSTLFQTDPAAERYRQLSTSDFMAVRELHESLGKLIKRRPAKHRN